MSGGGEEPISLDVQTPQGSTVARLLAGPRSTILGVKAQLAGVEGTAIDNQTLLLDGRVLDDGTTLLDSAVPAGGSATLTLVRCLPLLTGRLSKQDLLRLTTDGEALARSIDAFKVDPHYDAAEVVEIVTAAARAVRPAEHGLASEILESLPLELLASFHEVAEVRAPLEDASEESIAAVEATARCLLPEPAAEPPPRLMAESPSRAAGVLHFNISEDADPLIQRARRARRERFTSSVRTALELLLLALEEDT